MGPDLGYLSVSMVIKVASDNGYFLSTARFGHFRGITAQTSNGWRRTGSFWLGLLIVGDAAGFGYREDAGLRFLWLLSAYSQ